MLRLFVLSERCCPPETSRPGGEEEEEMKTEVKDVFYILAQTEVCSWEPRRSEGAFGGRRSRTGSVAALMRHEDRRWLHFLVLGSLSSCSSRSLAPLGPRTVHKHTGPSQILPVSRRRYADDLYRLLSSQKGRTRPFKGKNRKREHERRQDTKSSLDFSSETSVSEVK